MAWGGYLTGDMVRDPEIMESVMNGQQRALEEWAAQHREPVMPGTEEWVPEDETPDATTMDELGQGNLPSFIYAVVDKGGELDKRNALYSTLKGAKAYVASRWSGAGSKVVKGEVTWEQ